MKLKEVALMLREFIATGFQLAAIALMPGESFVARCNECHKTIHAAKIVEAERFRRFYGAE